ncbi:bifunctional isocitrate dehydrogenase kinase/phosphatase [Litoribacter ruber]|uniref:bifunctional isocitrate dehydrogenase kinase/phosphatase n=1 Tax=Litoribacter ruber TaxID=702568 RepID=UPI001BDB5C8D|nr:bifunctional isocitrate dehydrogenase kinase/phosphatase [Litoribacter ruber]MBT0810698.1 bifunctional isocitrate dehydrogenase kinase/phosphatase [Litoribacter ruber]
MTKLNFTYFLVSLFCLLLVFCSSPQEEHQDSEEQTDSLANQPKYEQILHMGIQKMPRWIEHWQMQGREFDKMAFKMHRQTEYEVFEWPEEYGMNSDYPLKAHQFVHPEDKGIVDLYDYKIDLDADGRVGFNPDSEVAYFRANGMKERLLFMGPMGIFEDAVWVTGSHLLVAGHVQEGEYFLPRIWLIIPDEHRYVEFHHPFSTTKYQSEQYLRKKLSNLNFPQ